MIFPIFLLNQRNINPALSYPGNGIPHLSKNKPVDIINIEMQDYFGKYSFLKSDGVNITFKNIPHSVKYQSSLNLIGPKTNFALDVSINSGKAIINIGDVKYILTPAESNIIQGNKNIFSEKDLKINGVSIEKGDSNKSVARFLGNGQSNGDYVDLNFPANISIELFENSSGVIGQWKWLRGFE